MFGFRSAGTGKTPDYFANQRLHGKSDSPMAKAKKAKKANPKAARPAKKTPIRKATKKPQPSARKKTAASKSAVKKVVATKTAKKPKAKPVSRRPRTASSAPKPVTAGIAPAIVPPAPATPPQETPPSPAAKSPVVASAPLVPAPPLPVAPDLLADNDPLAARKKGVRKATITSGLQDPASSRRLGRSRIPVDAPLDVVFQNDTQAREAFSFLGIHSIRELESFSADDLVLRLTGPAKLTVGRIRKILAMNNRCLTGDEDFAVDFQEQQRNPARGDL